MNVFLDMVVCGPGARMCGGITQILSSDDEVCNDFWGSLAAPGKRIPPEDIPTMIELSDSGDEGDSVSLLSEIEVAHKVYSRYREVMARQPEAAACAPKQRPQHDLQLQEENQASVFKDEYDSLAMSSFDSRMGDTRFFGLEEEAEEAEGKDDDDQNRVIIESIDDGSSYSSYYFRLRPSSKTQDVTPPRPRSRSRRSGSRHSGSWQTTSTRTTQKMGNPPILHSYYFDEV